MAYVIAFIVSIILYLGGGWCFYNIYLSVVPIEATDTLQDIACDQLLVYGIWATILIFFGMYMAERNGSQSNDFDTVAVFAPLSLWAIAKWVLPLSLGFGIINVVVVIVAITFALGQWFNRI